MDAENLQKITKKKHKKEGESADSDSEINTDDLGSDDNVSEESVDEVTKLCVISPDNKVKIFWDIYICIILLFECSVNPVIIAYDFEISSQMQMLSNIIDSSFAIDILLTFRSAYRDEKYHLIQDGKLLAINYIFGWLWIDVIAIIRFEWFINTEESGTDYASIVRTLKIGKLSKLVKMTKLIRFVRFFKFFRKKNKILDYIHNMVKVDPAVEKLFFFILVFFICGHILSCLWLMIAFY
jgi:hypothetical protein